jgi:LmbE family N-acetylglucosaminyl deacetylase
MPGAVRAMGTLRQNEALAAATQLGLSTNELVFLGYPDSGTLDIWKHHWRDTPPFRSPLTRANAVPYDRALTPGSAYAGEDILDDLDGRPPRLPAHLGRRLPSRRPQRGPPRALPLHPRRPVEPGTRRHLAPDLLAYPVHFTHWPEPRRHHPMRPASPPHFLIDRIDWQEFELAPFQVTNKRAALRRHHSQYPLLRRLSRFFHP